MNSPDPDDKEYAVDCEACNGRGECATCDGAGRIENDGPERACADCAGSGNCLVCDGSGDAPEERDLGAWHGADAAMEDIMRHG